MERVAIHDRLLRLYIAAALAETTGRDYLDGTRQEGHFSYSGHDPRPLAPARTHTRR
jgi:hypothetical protein